MSSRDSYRRFYQDLETTGYSSKRESGRESGEEDEYSTLPSRTDNQEIFLLKCKFIAITFALMFLMAVVLAGGLAFMVVIVSTKEQFDSVSAPVYNYSEGRYQVPTPDGHMVDITVFRPVKSQSVFNDLYPVILEVVGTRKDDIEYLQSYPYQVYFARRGYVFVSMDARGTGASGGTIGDNIHTSTEILDIETVLGYITEQYWSSGKVGLFGRGRSAETALLAAKSMNPENKTLALNHIDCIYIMNPSDDFYYGGTTYMDGGLHFDETLIKYDHLTGIPASPNYTLDENYYNQRVSQLPWIVQHLRHQRDSTYWNNNLVSRQNLSIPIYFVGGQFYPFVDYAFDIATQTKDQLPFYKLVVGPWNNTWAFQSRLTPTYDDMYESVRWFDTWLLNKYNQLSEEDHIQFYLRAAPEAPSELVKSIPGTWQSVPDLPIFTHQVLYYFCSGVTLSPVPCTSIQGDPIDSLDYQAGVGQNMDRWWGDLKGSMDDLDENSLSFTSPPLTHNLSIVGQVEVNFKIQNDVNISTFMIRLEEVTTNGSNFVSGRSVSLNQEVGNSTDPQVLKEGNYYSFSVKLRFVAYTFQGDNKIRLSFTNSLFPMYWPGTTEPGCHIVYADENSFISLPHLSQDASSGPEFTQTPWNSTENDVTPPHGWRYEAGGWPRNFMKSENNPSTTTTTTTYTYDTYTNINNTLIANYMGYSLFQSPSSSSSTTYVGYGASVYIFGVTEKFPPDSANCQNATREGMDSILFLEGVTDNFAGIFPSVENKVDLVCSDVPDFDMTGMNWFQVLTSVEICSDQKAFHVSFSRLVYGPDAVPLFNYTHEESIDRDFH